MDTHAYSLSLDEWLEHVSSETINDWMTASRDRELSQDEVIQMAVIGFLNAHEECMFGSEPFCHFENTVIEFHVQQRGKPADPSSSPIQDFLFVRSDPVLPDGPIDDEDQHSRNIAVIARVSINCLVDGEDVDLDKVDTIKQYLKGCLSESKANSNIFTIIISDTTISSIKMLKRKASIEISSSGLQSKKLKTGPSPEYDTNRHETTLEHKLQLIGYTLEMLSYTNGAQCSFFRCLNFGDLVEFRYYNPTGVLRSSRISWPLEPEKCAAVLIAIASYDQKQFGDHIPTLNHLYLSLTPDSFSDCRTIMRHSTTEGDAYATLGTIAYIARISSGIYNAITYPVISNEILALENTMQSVMYPTEYEHFLIVITSYERIANKLTPQNMYYLFNQLFDSLNNLYVKAHILHRDISPENVMCKVLPTYIHGLSVDVVELIVIDFDLATYVNETCDHRTSVGTLPFMAMELLPYPTSQVHCLRHGFGGVFYVALWFIARLPEGVSKTDLFVDWELTPAQSKSSFWIRDSWRASASPSALFAPYGRWLTRLWTVFRQGRRVKDAHVDSLYEDQDSDSPSGVDALATVASFDYSTLDGVVTHDKLKSILEDARLYLVKKVHGFMEFMPV